MYVVLYQVLIALGISLIMIGFLLMILAILLAGTKGGGRTSTGGIILIGPFPIVFGSKDIVKVMIALAIAMIAVLIIINIILFASG